MEMRISGWVMLVALVELGRARVAAQATPRPRIIGVYDRRSGAVIEDAEVTDILSGTHVATTVTGTAPLDFVVYQGDFALIEIRKIGFQPVKMILHRSDTTSITLVLERTAVELPAVVTTEKYRLDLDEGSRFGFVRRCGEPHIMCFAEDSLAARGTSTIADVLKHSGLTVKCAGAGTNSGRNRSLPSCTVPGCVWFIDGFRFQPYPFKKSDAIYPEIEKMLGPTQLAGIEVYKLPGPVPMKYQDAFADCSVVLWTK
jgi:hypothetical protein